MHRSFQRSELSTNTPHTHMYAIVLHIPNSPAECFSITLAPLHAYLFPECRLYDTRRAGNVASPSSSSQNVPRNGAGGGSCRRLPSSGTGTASGPASAGPTSPASAASSAALLLAARACRSSSTALRLLPRLPRSSPFTYDVSLAGGRMRACGWVSIGNRER